MVKQKPKMASSQEMATLWFIRYGTDSIGDHYVQRPIVCIQTIAKAFKLSPAQVIDRLKQHRLRQHSVENPEDNNRDVKEEPDLAWVTAQSTLHQQATMNLAERAKIVELRIGSKFSVYRLR